MSACCGSVFSVFLSDEGVVHSLGRNLRGQLGIEDIDNEFVEYPTAIPNLPKIKQVSCGSNFSVCLDENGAIWRFGCNNHGQIVSNGGDCTSIKTPKKIKNIPRVQLICCGGFHTLFITNDFHLWSFGRNDFGQLCLENCLDAKIPTKTSFSDIIKIAAGGYHSLFQNKKGEIYGCGYNKFGSLGLGNYNHPQVKPCLIPNQPENIVYFCCGYDYSLFLDDIGKVFSVGENIKGSLGIGNFCGQNTLNEIINIPPIQSISIVGLASYLIDFEGNIWSFGGNKNGQLGLQDKRDRNIPTKIETLKNIIQISSGCCGYHFFAKDSENKIFATGSNKYKQLGLEAEYTSLDIITPQKMNDIYNTIWGSPKNYIRAKSARK